MKLREDGLIRQFNSHLASIYPSGEPAKELLLFALGVIRLMIIA